MRGSQLTQLVIAYAVTAAGMLLMLYLLRAQKRAFWRWPVYSVIAMGAGIAAWNGLSLHVFPVSWRLIHANAMYAAALVLYALFGAGLGWLITRLTRSRPTEFADIPDSPEDVADDGGRRS